MELNIVEALNLALKQEMEKDENVVILGEDVGKEGGVFRVTAGLQEKFGQERVFDTPLSESGIIGTSIGMSLYGLKPVAEIQFMGFLYPGIDQLISHASRLRNRSRGKYTCPMVLRMPCIGGIKALEHHSESTEALLAHIPGLKVVMPSTPYDAKGLLISAIRDPDPVIFLEPKKIYRSFKEYVDEKEYSIPLGKAKLLKEGNDLTLISWGSMVHECRKAVENSGKSIELIDIRTISPLDVDMIINSVNKTGRAVIVHEAPRTCGFGAEISALINERALLSLKAPVERVTGFDTVVPLPKHEDYYFPNSERILDAIKKVMSY